MAAYTNTTMLADTSDVSAYMGENVSANYTETMQDLEGVFAEASLCVLIKYDAVTNWGSLNAIYKLIFSEYVARAIANVGIMYNPTGYSSQIDAEDKVIYNLFKMQEIIKLLDKSDIQDFLGV